MMLDYLLLEPDQNSIQFGKQWSNMESVRLQLPGFVHPRLPEYICLADASYGVIDPERTGSP